MLVLSRKLNESILIGDQIQITVVGFRGNCVRLGIAAPGNVSILRQELVVPAAPDLTTGAPDIPPAGQSHRREELAV
jgi:carbon storage regulator